MQLAVSSHLPFREQSISEEHFEEAHTMFAALGPVRATARVTCSNPNGRADIRRQFLPTGDGLLRTHAHCGEQLRWQAGHLRPVHRRTGVGKPAHGGQNCFRCRHSGTQLDQPLCARRLQPAIFQCERWDIEGMKRERKSSGIKLFAINSPTDRNAATLSGTPQAT